MWKNSNRLIEERQKVKVRINFQYKYFRVMYNILKDLEMSNLQ